MGRRMFLWTLCFVAGVINLFGERTMEVSLLESVENADGQIAVIGEDEEKNYDMVFLIPADAAGDATMIEFNHRQNYPIDTKYDTIEMPSFISYNGNRYPVTCLGTMDYPERFSYGFTLKPRQLKRLVIPATIEKINVGRPFIDVDVKEFFVEDENHYYSVEDGAVVSADKSTIVYFAKEENDVGYRIPSSVVSIYPYTFFYVSRTIYLNDNFPVLPDDLFFEIKTAPYPADNVEIIGEYSLAYPYYNGSILLPPGIKEIEDWGMYSGEPIFYSSLAGNYTSIVVPASLEKIGEYALMHGARKNSPPMLGDIVFMGQTPPQSANCSMTNWTENYIPEEGNERMKVYVPKDAVAAYQELVDNGTWSTINEILPQPDELRVSSELGIGEWKHRNLELTCRLYELGDAKVSKMEWSVDDPRIAVVDPESGCLTAKEPGKVKVKLEITDTYGKKYLSESTIRIDDKALNGSGIEECLPEHDYRHGVWNMQGVKIEHSDRLPSGIYIIDGKKVLIK